MEVATSIEDTVRFDMGTWIIDMLGSTNVAQQKLGPHRAWAIIMSQPQTSGLQPANTASKGPPILQTKLPAYKGVSCPQPSQHKPAEIRAAPGIAPGRAGPICYQCGQLLQVAQATQVLWKSRPEVRKFGGFLELASAHALCLRSVASRVFQMEVRIEFLERAGMEKCTGMVPSMSTKMWEAEVQSSYSSEVRGMHGVELIIGRVE